MVSTTLDEIIEYCNLDFPAGALLLTGEWGCGKTFLIENQLKEALLKTHVIIRISLFGVASREELQSAVNKAWLSSLAEDKGLSKKLVQQVKNVVNVARNFYSFLNTIVSIDFTGFIPITNKLNDKKVILVFDDLERANHSLTDIFGCINEYCENLHFNVVLVANEGIVKKHKSDEVILYEQLKEKAVQRTLAFEPDRDEVIENVVNSFTCNNKEYKTFLMENIGEFKSLFSDTVDSVKGMPFNIRSFKYALQDFERVYVKLSEKRIEQKYVWLLSFVTYVVAFRAGHIEQKEGKRPNPYDNGVKEHYLEGYSSGHILISVVDWVNSGRWDEEKINAELENVIERSKSLEPKEVVRLNRLVDIDDEIIELGFPGFLQMAYNGELSLDEYVQFINDFRLAREYNVALPETDWGKVREGIKKRMQALVDSCAEEQRTTISLGDDNSKNFYTETEWETYKLIRDFRENRTLTSNKNEKEYVRLMAKDADEAFIKCHDKWFKSFTDNMADATADAFVREHNAIKAIFPYRFNEMWRSYLTVYGMDKEATVKGLRYLESRMENIKDDYINKRESVAAKHAENFLSTINELINPPS